MKLSPLWLGLNLAFVCLQFLLGNHFAAAQESSVRPPALAFDLSGKSLGQSKLLKNFPIPPSPNGGNVLAAKRLYGVLSFPDSMMEVLQMQPNSPPPIDLLLVGEFDSKQEREQLISDAMVEDSERTEFNGKSYYVAPDSDLLLLSLEDKRFDGGSRDYLAVPRQSLLSPQLKAAMSELGNAPAKLALDLTQDREVVAEAIALIKQQGVSPLFSPFLDLPKKIDQLMLAIDPNSENLMRLLVKSSNANDAAFVKKSLESVLGIAQMGLSQAPKGDPSVELIGALLKGAKISVEENRVSMIISKPSGFDEMVAQSLIAAQQAAAKMQKMNNMKQLLLSMHNYDSAMRTIPFRHEIEDRLSAQISWRVKVLPYLFDQTELYQQFRLDEAWDSETNKPLADQCPELMGTNGMATICWIESEAKGFQDITDGMSFTICMIENPKGTPWTKPVDITMDEAEKMVLGLADGESLMIGMYDGSVRTIDNKIDKEKLRALLTINGGETIEGFDDF